MKRNELNVQGEKKKMNAGNVFFYWSLRSTVQKCLISDRLSPKMLPIWKAFLKLTWLQSWAKQTNCLTKHTQTGWLEDSQSSTVDTWTDYSLRIAVQTSKSSVRHSQLPDWPQISARGLWSVTEIITESTELTEGQAERQLKEERFCRERWRDLKVIEDSISSSLVPHVLQKAKGFWKTGEAEWSRCCWTPTIWMFFQKAAGSRGWSVCRWRHGRTGTSVINSTFWSNLIKNNKRRENIIN